MASRRRDSDVHLASSLTGYAQSGRCEGGCHGQKNHDPETEGDGV